jgi:ATP-dependent phosphofructokinase / diphosphate-dependent phosphofructokinase
MKIGMLTGGGDCPGLNAVIRAVVRKGVFHYQDQFVGFMEGWRGLLDDFTHVSHEPGEAGGWPAALS